MSKTEKLFSSCIIFDDALYYISCGDQALKKINLLKGKINYINNPEGYTPGRLTTIVEAITDGEKIYLFERTGKKVMEYSPWEDKCRSFEVDYGVCEYLNLAACQICGGKLHIFPSFLNKVIKINLELGKVEYGEALWVKELRSVDIKKGFLDNGTEVEIPCRLFSCGCSVENIMWLFAEREGFVIRYNALTESFERFELPERINGCVHAVQRNGLFYILSLEGSVYSWNIKNDEVRTLWTADRKNKYPYFGKIAVSKKNIWMLPAFGEDIYIISLVKNDIKIYDSYPEDFQYFTEFARANYYGYCEDSKYYYCAMNNANYMLKIDKKEGKAFWLKPIQPSISEKMAYLFRNYNIRDFEEKEFGVSGLLELAQCGLDDCNHMSKGVIGERIWEIEKIYS